MPTERAASALSAEARVPGPWLDERPADAQPGGRDDGDARELEHAVSDDQPQQVVAVAGARRQPDDGAEQDAVRDEHVARQQAERHAARVGEERHLDVVDEDPDRDAGMLAGAVQDESLVLRLGHAAHVGGHEAAGRRRVAERPQRRQHGGHEQQQPGRDQGLRPLGHRSPVAVREVGASDPRRAGAP